MARGQAVLALRAAIHFVCILHLSIKVDCNLAMLNLDLLAFTHIVGGLTYYAWVLCVQHVVHVVC